MPTNAELHEAYASFAVLMTAVAAIGLTYWQIYISREHNRLSTLPAIQINNSLSQVDDPALLDDDDDDDGLYLENNGLGPARVISIEYFMDGKPVTVVPTSELSILDQITAPLKSSKVLKSFEIEEIEVGDFLKPGEEVKILTAKSKHVEKREEWIKFVRDQIGVQVAYCSIYEQCEMRCYNAPPPQAPKYKGC